MSGDLISRQDVLDAVNDCGICIQRILDIPSAEPERKTGKWIETEFMGLRECSNCSARWGIYSIEDFDYCPSCGADMRGDR